MDPEARGVSGHVPDCPECGEEMVKRRNHRTGEQFWGCPLFPQCDGSVPIDEPVKRGDPDRYPAWARGKDS